MKFSPVFRIALYIFFGNYLYFIFYMNMLSLQNI